MILGFVLPGAFSASAQKGKTASKPTATIRTIVLTTEPDASVWINGVLWGTTDEQGKITLRGVPAGAHGLRVRADGFKEATQTISAVQKGDLRVNLTKTTDEAELTFQQAEKATSDDKNKAAELYRKAVKLRPAYAEAYVGLARALADLGEMDAAHEAIAGARKARPVYPEASAVEGRLFKSEGDEEKAVEAFKRAVREGKGFQPEANTGLALLYKERAESAGVSGDFQGEQQLYAEAVKYFAPAVKQLGGAPDAVIVYQLYGLVFEKMEKYREAIAVYEDFLRIFPDTSEASAVQSFIVQLKKQMAEQ
ncbi:MAG: tetratricopeptide repeat protein [Pyrinomonadaceae bacterium]